MVPAFYQHQLLLAGLHPLSSQPHVPPFDGLRNLVFCLEQKSLLYLLRVYRLHPPVYGSLFAPYELQHHSLTAFLYLQPLFLRSLASYLVPVFCQHQLLPVGLPRLNCQRRELLSGAPLSRFFYLVPNCLLCRQFFYHLRQLDDVHPSGHGELLHL